MKVLGTSLELYFCFLINLLNTREETKTLFTFIVDCGWKSRLPSLARVLLCLVRVGGP